ncbi:hypothetical protein GCM10027162_52750 [Streptomyces incanus]
MEAGVRTRPTRSPGHPLVRGISPAPSTAYVDVRAGGVRNPVREETRAVTIPLVVGVDGSEASLEAVDWAAEESVRHGVPLRLLHAAVRDDEAADVIGAAAERARKTAPTVPLSSEVVREDAARALVGEGRNAFALVLGPRGLGGLSGMLLGSVGLAVAARADCPVVVVRGAAEHRDGRFGNIVVGVEEGEGSGTAVRFALREAQVRRCRLVAVHAWSTVAGALPPTSGPVVVRPGRPPASTGAGTRRRPA